MVDTRPTPQTPSAEPRPSAPVHDRPTSSSTPAGPGEPVTRLAGQVWAALRRYPLPLGALVLMLVAGVLWLAGRPDLAQWPLVAIILVGGVPLAIETFGQLLNAEFGVDLIAVLAIAGSLLLGEYLAGALVVLMLSGGEALEAYALRRARSSLSALAERAPRTAHLRTDGHLRDVAAEAVEIGEQVVVKPGELVPVDGVVVDGSSSVSEADLTGEPLPIRKEAGALVMSGSVNIDAVLDIRATMRSADSQYAQIVRLVEQAQAQRAPIHRLADRYGAGFTLIAIAMAAAAWALSGDTVYALAVLVVATPCPLILATPIAIMSGIDVAAHQGIIVKSGAVIEQMGEVDTAVFDKTGTLTLGVPRVIGAIPAAPGGTTPPYDADTLLRLAASVEQYSAHILARTVVEAAKARDLPPLSITGFAEVLGKGVRASVTWAGTQPGAGGAADVEVAIGNRTFMRSLDVDLPPELIADRERRVAEGQIVSIIAVARQVAGLLVFADVPRQELAQLVPALRGAGIQHTVLLTGDGEVVAKRIGALAQVDIVYARCLPERKVEVVRALQAQGQRVLMVGDGINDAPALASATVGMAIGAQGLTAAAAAADAVLLSPDILRVAGAVRLGRRVLRVALQGIWAGIGLSLIAMVLAAFGFIPPAAGALLQEGIDVLVILNALRAGRS